VVSLSPGSPAVDAGEELKYRGEKKAIEESLLEDCREFDN
jgi:hypothetical protein